MLDQLTKQRISTTLDEFVQKSKMFTAWDITKVIRKKGITVPHNNIRDYVHSCCRFYALYNRVLIDINPTKQAWLYHPCTTDHNKYYLLANVQKVKSAIKHVAKSSTTISKTEVHRSLDQRGRVCILARYIRDLGFDPKSNYTIGIFLDVDRLSIFSSNQSSLPKMDRYFVDSSGNIRLGKRIFRKAGLEDGEYIITMASDRIDIRPKKGAIASMIAPVNDDTENPGNYFFAFNTDEVDTIPPSCFGIIRKKEWNDKQIWADDGPCPDFLLKEGFLEIQECCYEYDGFEQDGKDILLKLGIKENIDILQTTV